MVDLSKHPCFNNRARLNFGRIHLPVAPACNVKCNFCDRKYSCVNECRPGVTASILTPEEALHHLDNVMNLRDDIAVAGIAGPGDPFANSLETLTTLKLIRKKYPTLLLCVATNGLNLLENIDALSELCVSHVTVTVNGIDADVVKNIYEYIILDGICYTGRDAAEILISRQKAGIKALINKGIITKVNTIIIPGVNETHIVTLSKELAEWGVDIQNCIPLLPVKGTLFQDKTAPSPEMIHSIRSHAGEYIIQMSHCNRCRADACGMLN